MIILQVDYGGVRNGLGIIAAQVFRTRLSKLNDDDTLLAITMPALPLTRYQACQLRSSGYTETPHIAWQFIAKHVLQFLKGHTMRPTLIKLSLMALLGTVASSGWALDSGVAGSRNRSTSGVASPSPATTQQQPSTVIPAPSTAAPASPIITPLGPVVTPLPPTTITPRPSTATQPPATTPAQRSRTMQSPSQRNEIRNGINSSGSVLDDPVQRD